MSEINDAYEIENEHHDTEEEPVAGDTCVVIEGIHKNKIGKITAVDKDVIGKELKVQFNNGLFDYVNIRSVI